MAMAKQPFSGSNVSNEPMLTPTDHDGSHNYNMVATKPEVPISRLSGMTEIKLQLLSYNLRVTLVLDLLKRFAPQMVELPTELRF